MAAAVRQQLEPLDNQRRTLDERIAIRFPRLIARQAQLIARLRPSSRVRRAAFARTARLAIAAYNRRDVEAMSALSAPGYEYRPAREWVEAGLVDSCYRGRDGHRRYIASVDQVWGGENYLKVRELIDLGDRIVIFADGDMRAQASGVPLQQSFALVCTLEDGLPTTLQEYYDDEDALRAVGLR